jgi:molybdopterin converting factor small subunit
MNPAKRRTRRIHLRYYGALQELFGRHEECLETSATTPAELWNILNEGRTRTFPAANLRVAIGHNFAEWQTDLKDNDLVVFIPPVAGG